MERLNNDTRKLLDKLYNLRGKNSVILEKISNENKEAVETRDKTEIEKKELEEAISSLTADEKLLADQGEKLKLVLSSIKKEDFAIVLDKLNIDFDPEEINRKVNETLPLTIKKVVQEKEASEKKLINVEKEMESAITSIEELSIRKDEALADQNKLNEYFKLSLAGNINITRDSITSLLEKFKFSEEDQREAAKILMFPEDGLYKYEDEIKNEIKVGKSISDVIMEAKESAPEEIKLDTISVVDNILPTPEEKSNLELISLLESFDINIKDFNNSDLSKLESNYSQDLLKENIEYANKLGINKDLFIDNVDFLIDKEFKEKINKLTSIGKAPFDIYLNPNILMKYNLEELNHAINNLMESGLDPRKVPLMAF